MNARRASDATGEKRAAKRAEIIRVGMAVFTQRGFHSIGLDELIRAAGIPKGSFYYYFDSKDEFALSVVRAYGKYFAHKISSHLDDRSRTPITRLRDFCNEAILGVRRYEFTRGCLIGNIGQEMGTLDETFRLLTSEVLQDWRNRVRDCLGEAAQLGEIARDADATSLAEFFWSAWEGGVMCAKLERSVRPMEIVADTFFIAVLHSSPPKHPSTRRGARNSAADFKARPLAG